MPFHPEGHRRFPKGDRKALWSPVRAKLHLADKILPLAKVVLRHKEKPPPGGGSAVRRWGSLRCCGHDLLQGVAFDDCSFSGLRKNQRGPEGVSQFIPPGDTPSGLPPFPRSLGVIWLAYPQTPRRGGPFRGRSDGVRVRRRCAARRNCCRGCCLMPVTRFCRSNQGAFRSPFGNLRAPSVHTIRNMIVGGTVSLCYLLKIVVGVQTEGVQGKRTAQWAVAEGEFPKRSEGGPIGKPPGCSEKNKPNP